MLDVGFKNYVDKDRILFVIPPNTSKAKRIIKEALLSRKLINCTNGRKVNSILVLNTYHMVLSPLKCSSIKNKLDSIKNKINSVEEKNEEINESPEESKDNSSLNNL